LIAISTIAELIPRLQVQYCLSNALIKIWFIPPLTKLFLLDKKIQLFEFDMSSDLVDDELSVAFLFSHFGGVGAPEELALKELKKIYKNILRLFLL
jgi:hypothetical protein